MPILNDNIRSMLQMTSNADGKRLETIFSVIGDMYPALDYQVSYKSDIANLSSYGGPSYMRGTPRVTLTCDGMPINTVEETADFLLAHGKSEQEVEDVIRMLNFILSLGV